MARFRFFDSADLRWMFTIVLFLNIIPLAAQRAFTYKAVVQNKETGVVSNQPGIFRASIFEENLNGYPAYAEMQQAWTDDCGVATLKVGVGTKITGDLMQVDWTKQCYLVVEYAPDQEGPFSPIVVNEITAVPVALYAASSASSAMPGCSAFGVCVKDFGAVGDGSTDDTPAFEDALDSAALHGHRVIVPAGIYKITSTLVVPDGVMIVGEGAGSTPLGTPLDGSQIKYNGVGAAIELSCHNCGLRDLVIADMTVGENESDGVHLLADNRLSESIRIENLLITNFTGGTAFKMEAKNGGGIYYGSFYDLRIRHAKRGIHISQDATSAVNSNSFVHGVISGGGFEYGVLVEGGNNNTFYGTVIEPPQSTAGHFVVNSGEVKGIEIRIEGTSQPATVPLVSFAAATRHSELSGTYGGGLTIDQGANYLNLRSGKALDHKPDSDNLLQNATFHGFDGSSLPYWELIGTGVTASILPPELSEEHRVLKLTIPAGVVADLRPSTLFVPKLMGLPKYGTINFGAFVKIATPGIAYTRYNSATGITASTPHPGDNKWHFIGMSMTTGPSPDPRVEVNNTTGAPLEVFVTMPTLNFGPSFPSAAPRPILTSGGILTGTLSQGMVEVSPSGPFIVLPKDGNIFVINGTPTITRINYLLADRFPKGTVIHLLFNSSGANVTSSAYISLKSGFTSTSNSSLTLVSNGDGTWRELNRNL